MRLNSEPEPEPEPVIVTVTVAVRHAPSMLAQNTHTEEFPGRASTDDSVFFGAEPEESRERARERARARVPAPSGFAGTGPSPFRLRRNGSLQQNSIAG